MTSIKQVITSMKTHLPSSDFHIFFSNTKVAFYAYGTKSLVIGYTEWPNYFRDKSMALEAINILDLEFDMRRA